MGKKGKKTRWRVLPIGGTDEEGGLSLETAPPATTDLHRHITFNEDEYTKITTPRQDVLFKKGYLGRKRAAAAPSPCDTQEVHSNDSVESESYISEEPMFVYPPPTGYMDPTGLYYGNACEVYDPYTNTVVTMVVGPPQHCPGAPLLAAVPCQPVPLQQLEWAPPAPGPWCYSYDRKKRYSTDSQNCSAQSSESTGPPGSPQEPVEEACAPAMYPPQYVYPGYMFGPPVYTMNGMTVQGMIPQPIPMAQPDLSSKRRKKRRRRRRGGVTDDGSESSCCEEACMPGDSSDAGSKGNSDSGIHTDPTPSPPLADDEPECNYQQKAEYVSQLSETSQEEPSEELSTAEDDVTTNVCATAVEFSSQECTLSRSSSPRYTKDFETNDNDSPTHNVLPTQETFVCQDEERVDNSCPFSQEPVLVCNNQDQVANCIPFTQVAVPTSQVEDRVSGSLTSMQETDVTCKNEDQGLQSCSLREETVEVCHNEDREDNSFLLTHETIVVCPDEELVENCVLNETNDLSPSILVSPEIPDPLLLDNSSDDLKTAHEEYKEVSERIKENTKEVPEVNCDEKLCDEDNPVTLNSHHESQTAQLRPKEGTETILIKNDEKEEFDLADTENEVKEEVPEPEFVAIITQDIEASADSRFEDAVPVPPPRRKRSMCRAADKLATRIVEEAIREGVEEAAHSRLSSPLSITEAVTRWLNSHESSPLTCRFPDSESEDEEGVEAVEEMEMTGPKNVQGNPFPVPFHNGLGQRVAKDCDSVMSEWDFDRARDMCDPARSVDKYYRLGADGGEGDRMPPSVYKTAMHLRHNGPFPCGVCCIIQ